MIRVLKYVLAVVAVLALGPLVRGVFDNAVQAQDWRTASQEPAGWAPSPGEYVGAVAQAYCAPVVRWRGAVADHCWVAAKAEGAQTYQRYEVIGWNLRRGRSVVSVSDTPTPDRAWYGKKPKLIQDIRGEPAARIAAALPAAAASYPYPDAYTMWPGPNSNTFIAHLGRELPEMELVLPGRAIGKDYIPGNIVARTPSGTGAQVSLFGALGVSLGAGEGLEVNVLGLVVGVDPLDFALTLPGLGRIPWSDDWTDGKAAESRAP
jgi:hypothetical protein